MELNGIMHCHSSYSYDAKLSLAEIKALCQKNGIQFVCMTEHTDLLTPERAEEFVGECDTLSDELFCFIPGFEVPFEDAHILMIGARAFASRHAPTIEELKKWTGVAPFVVLAHPVRNRFKVSDALLEETDALEVWNQQYEGKRVPRPRSLRLFETLRKQKPTLVATCGTDFHREAHLGSPLVSLNVTDCSEAQILEKLSIGAFRAHSKDSSFYGILPNAHLVARSVRAKSALSVLVIGVGKMANALFAKCGVRLPRALTRFVRQRV